MAVTNEPHLTIRAPYPTMIRKDIAVTTSLDVLLDGSAPTLTTASTYTLTSPSGTDVISAQAVTTAGAGSATYDIGADVLDDYEEGPAWTEKWSITDGTDTWVVRREAALIRYELYPPLSGADIVADEFFDLNDHLSGYSKTAQDFVDSAWRDILARLFALEELPFHIVSSWALKPSLNALALHKACRFLGRTQADANKWLELAKEFKESYERAWAEKTFLLDRDSDGEPDDDIRENSGTLVQPNAYTSGRLTSWRY